MTIATTVHAADYLAEGVVIDNIVDVYDEYGYYQRKDVQLDLNQSNRFYDGGKGDWGWNNYSVTSAAKQLYVNNGKDLNVFGSLASSLSASDSSVNFGNLKADSQQCWAYTSANMIQYWQTYYGVFAHKAGQATEANTPVHGYSYDAQYMTQLGGTQSLQLNKLFYDSFNNKGGQPQNAFGWYLSHENDWTGQKDLTSSPGYFREYFASYRDTMRSDNVQNMSSPETVANQLKQAFGYTNQNGEWVQTTKGQIVHLELKAGNNSHAITCYGFETDDAGNIKALYIVNSDDATYELVKVYTKFETYSEYDYRLSLHYDEECSGLSTYNAWTVAGWSIINTPDSLKQMLATYEKGNLTWMGNLESWTNASTAAGDPNVLPTDETGWMVYAADNNGNHAGYYNAHYTTGRGVEFNDAATFGTTPGTVNVAEDITVSSMEVNNDTLAYEFKGEGLSITTDEFSKTGAGSVLFDGVKLTAGKINLKGNVTFDELHVKESLYASGQLTASSATLNGDASVNSVNSDIDLTITGGTTTIRDSGSWTNMKSLAVSEEARLTVGASLHVAENITTTATTTGTLAEGTESGVNAAYCITVGTEGDSSTGHVTLAGSMTAGSYIHIQGDANITGNISTNGTQWGDADSHITIGGKATIGGNLAARQYVTIGGDASIGGTTNVGSYLTVEGSATLSGATTVGGKLSVKGDLTSSTPGTTIKAGTMELSSNVSKVNLEAQTITMGSADGSTVTMDSVGVTADVLNLTNAVVTGDCSFTALAAEALTMNADGVTFVLDDSNSYTAQPFTPFSLDPLTQTQTLTISSSMLEGVNVNGSITLDLSHWAQTITDGGYESVILDFTSDMSFDENTSVIASFDGGQTYISASEMGDNEAIFNFGSSSGGGEAAIPEPTTATLSLLALAALAARRRRK